MIIIDASYCKGCGICVHFCARKVLEMSDEVSILGYCVPRVVDEGKCNKCRQCELYCPDFAVFIVEDKEGGNG